MVKPSHQCGIGKQGIAEKWAEAGTPEGARLAAEYMQAPAPARISSAAAVAMTGACFGLLAYRRPRLAAGVAGQSAASMYSPQPGGQCCASDGAKRQADSCITVPRSFWRGGVGPSSRACDCDGL